MEKLAVEISISGYKGLTASKVEDALNYYFGSTVDISVKDAAAQSVHRTAVQACGCPVGVVHVGDGKVPCGL